MLQNEEEFTEETDSNDWMVHDEIFRRWLWLDGPGEGGGSGG